jgi:hypothetical protein
MHRLARRAGYPSDSSRADRHQPRARLAGGGPLLYHYAGDLLRHLRHRPGRPAAGRCHLCARPGAGPGEKPPSPHPAAGAGPGAVPHRHRLRAAGAGPDAVPRRGLLSLERGPASVTAPGRRSAPGPVPGRAAARPGGPVATDCAARGGSTGLHSGLRTGRIAGLLCRPWAGRHEHGCHVVGAVPGRQRREEIAAVGRARCGPADPPMSGVRAGARTAMQVKFATRAAGRGSRAGRRTGPARVSGESAYPRARAACRVSRAAGGVLTLGPGAAILASQAAGGALTGPWPAPAAGLGRAGRARATRTTPPPELRDGRRGRPGPVSRPGPETRTTLPPEPRAGREDGRA